jgi:beta-glucanase (GH16 family)
VVLYLVSVVAVACLVVAALVIVRDYQSRDQVPNGDAKYDLTGWQVGSDAGRTSLNRLHIEDGPAGHDTAALIDRNGEGFGDWSRALVAIDRPAEALTVGRTYTLRAYVRNRGDSRQSVGLLLANGNYEHRPTESSTYDSVPVGGWHALVLTFISTAPAADDTAVYLALPRSGPTHWSVTGVSLRAGTPGDEGTAAPTSYRQAPDRVLRFDGPSGSAPDPTVWTNELGGNGWGNKELQTYTAGTRNVALDGKGKLVITVRREDSAGPDGINRRYTSARLNTHGRLDVPSGSYVEATVRAPVGIGVWPAFWLLGSNIKTVGWPACGELDVLEGAGANPSTVVSSLHMADTEDPHRDRKVGGGAPDGKTVLPHTLDASSHVYGVFFDSTRVTFYIDHRPTLTYTAREARRSGRDWPFDKSQSIILNVAIDSGYDPSATKFPRSMTVGPISIWNGRVPF